MNQFVQQFGDRIKNYWDSASDDERQRLTVDILQFANANPQTFTQDMKKIQFDDELTPLSLVLEALSKDTETWGQFYVDTLDKIVEQAKKSKKPNDILSNLAGFTFIEDDTNPFVQRIVDRLDKETNSENLPVKLAAIWMLPAFFTNQSLRNLSLLINSLQQKLYDKNWKVRYVAYTSLGFEDLVPPGYKLSFMDKMRTLIFGEPPTV